MIHTADKHVHQLLFCCSSIGTLSADAKTCLQQKLTIILEEKRPLNKNVKMVGIKCRRPLLFCKWSPDEAFLNGYFLTRNTIPASKLKYALTAYIQCVIIAEGLIRMKWNDWNLYLSHAGCMNSKQRRPNGLRSKKKRENQEKEIQQKETRDSKQSRASWCSSSHDKLPEALWPSDKPKLCSSSQSPLLFSPEDSGRQLNTHKISQTVTRATTLQTR